jgi:hypothetical protein
MTEIRYYPTRFEQKCITNSIRHGAKEPGGILLYSHLVPLADDGPPENSKELHSREPDKVTTNDPTLKVQSRQDTTDTFPGRSLDTQGVNNSSALHPNSANEITESSPRNPRGDLASEKPSNNFHVFTWLNEAQPTTWRANPLLSSPDQGNGNDDVGGSDIATSFILDEMNLRADLKELHRFLQRQTSFEDRVAYQECPQQSRNDIYALLRKEEKELAALTGKEFKRKKIYEDKVEVVNKAETIFRFFLPSGFEGRTVGKFWGALHRLLVVSIWRSHLQSPQPSLSA